MNSPTYETLPDLVEKIGDKFIINKLATYIIDIDTDKALNSIHAFDFDFDFEKDTMVPIIDSLKQNSQFTKLDDKNEILYALGLIDKILNYCLIDFTNVDYFLISNAGKYHVRLAIKPEKKKNTGNTIYLDIQCIRIAIIDELVTNKINNVYNILDYGTQGAIFAYILYHIYSIVNA
jgi:hypothetical protein